MNDDRVRGLVQSKGDRLLELVGERPLDGARWACHSHGAVLAAESPHPGIFERLVLVLPRPSETPPEEFRTWAEGRLERLDRYLERTNLGRVLRQVPTEVCTVASVARRVGHDPSTPSGYFPPPEDLPVLLRGFVHDLELYLRVMGDAGLRYLGGVRFFLVPRGAEPPEWKLGVDVLDTVIGRAEETPALAPMTLVRAVLSEFASIADVRALLVEGTRADRRRAQDAARHYGQALSALAERAAQPGFMLTHVEKQLAEIPPPPRPRRAWPWLAVLGACACALLWFWLG